MKADDIKDIKLRDAVWHLRYKASMTSNSPTMALVDKDAIYTVVDRLLELLDKEMTNKLTTTPWVVGYEALSVEGRTEKGTMKICDIRGWGHLTGEGHGALGMSFEDAKAVQVTHANLIAAAPDLLEALEIVVSVSDRKTKEYDMARAAIAKAKGATA